MKIFITFLVILAIFTGNNALAQNQQPALPSAGLTPESPFYFLDRLGEVIQQFFTFNPDSKAHLQITFAAERVAEIKVMLETKGIHTKGIEVAEDLLRTHIASAATIVVDQKAEGKDVSQLAKDLDDEFATPKIALEQTFKDEQQIMEAKEKELKAKIRAARQASNTTQVEALAKELSDVKTQKELLDLKKEDQEKALENENERIREEMEIQVKAEKTIQKAEEKKQEILDETAKDGLTVPMGTFDKFDKLLAQAKLAFAAQNYEEARRLAQQAKKGLEIAEKAIENLKEAKDNQEEIKADQEESEKEINQTQDEKVKEKAKEEKENLKEEQKKAAEETRKAEKQLRDAGNEEDN